MRLDLNQPNVHEVDLSVDQARQLVDEPLASLEELSTALDSAQGSVHSGEASVAYVVIKITK